jgi:hypothetical protein
MDSLSWLENWYKSTCNGEWEDSYGIKIQTLDNPGWMVQIDIRETALEEKEFSPVVKEESKDDWVYCKVENGEFCGFGDKSKLSYIINVFKEWTEK